MILSKLASTFSVVPAAIILVLSGNLFFVPTADANWLVNWEAGLFLEYTDNATRSDGNSEDDYVIEPYGSITATHLGPRFDLELSAYNEYRGYSDGTLGNRNDFDLDAILDWKIVPDLFHWTFEDHFSSDFPIDVRDAPNQRNQQNVNTFVTGPTFTPRIFNNTFLNLQGRYINTEAEDSDVDSDRYQGLVGVRRVLSPNSDISLNYQHEDVRFDEDRVDLSQGNIDFTRNDYFAVYSANRNSLSFSAQIGYTKINRDEGPNKSSEGNNNSVSINYTINSTSSLGFTAYDQYSDLSSNSVGDEFGIGGGFGGVGGVPGGIDANNSQFGDFDVNVTGDTIDVQGASVEYSKTFTKLSSIIRLFTIEEEYDIVTFNDREVDGIEVEFTLPYGSVTEFNLTTEYRETEFEFDDREDEDLYLALQSRHQYTRNWRFESGLEYRDRDTDAVNRDFDEYVIRVGAIYSNF